VFHNNGVSYCKFVVMATPPHCAHEINYVSSDPSSFDENENEDGCGIDSNHSHLLNSMQMGSIIKTITLYPSSFWLEGGFNGLITDNNGPIRFGFDATFRFGFGFS